MKSDSPKYQAYVQILKEELKEASDKLIISFNPFSMGLCGCNRHFHEIQKVGDRCIRNLSFYRFQQDVSVPSFPDRCPLRDNLRYSTWLRSR